MTGLETACLESGSREDRKGGKGGEGEKGRRKGRLFKNSNVYSETLEESIRHEISTKNWGGQLTIILKYIEIISKTHRSVMRTLKMIDDTIK